MGWQIWRSALLVAFAALAPAGVAQADEGETGQQLPGWMAGCWMTQDEGSSTEECWTVPRGTMMLGSSHTFDGSETRWFEHMRIVREGGALVFIAQPGGVPPTRFAMAAAPTGTDGQPVGVLFVSAEHDYPQRVQYFLDADGALVGEISMLDGSRVQRWVYRRAGAP